MGTEICGVDGVFPPGDIWFGSGAYTYCVFIYDAYLDV